VGRHRDPRCLSGRLSGILVRRGGRQGPQ